MNYRQQARLLLEAAREKLDDVGAENISYIALDLRMALECLVYERAELYKEEISEEQMRTWQPPQLMKYLLEIDPTADQSSTLSYKVDSPEKSEDEEYKHVGKENVISLKELRSSYNRLGAYLHSPTAAQLEAKGSIPLSKKIKRCNEVISLITDVLSSSMTQVNFRQLVDIDCDKCGGKIIRRIPPGSDNIAVKCTKNSCIATYVMRIENQKAHWRRAGVDIECRNEGCDEKNFVWENEMSVATEWKCVRCKQKNKLALTSILA